MRPAESHLRLSRNQGGLNALGVPTEISNAILTPAGDQLVLPLSVTSRAAYEITLESAAPKVVSITPMTGAGSGQVRCRVIFGRAVAGFDSADDVTITGTGASVARRFLRLRVQR